LSVDARGMTNFIDIIENEKYDELAKHFDELPPTDFREGFDASVEVHDGRFFVIFEDNTGWTVTEVLESVTREVVIPEEPAP